MKITKLEYQKKDPQRVNIYLDEEYAFSMHINDLLEFSVSVGQSIEQEKIEQIIKNDVYTRMYNRVISLITGTLKTRRQIEQYVQKTYNARKKDWLGNATAEVELDDLTSNVISRLESLQLLDDKHFASAYIDSYYLVKPTSIYELRGKLMSKGVSREDIDSALQEKECDEEEMLRFALQKKYKTDSIKRDDKKIINYFARKGFSWDLISKFIIDD